MLLATAVCVSAEPIRVATYNLNNYLVMDRLMGEKWRPDYPKPESEKMSIRRMIKSTLPDILAVQEIGSAELLEELRADLALEGVHYPYAVHMVAEDTERHLGVISKLPPKDVVKHTDLDFKYYADRERVKRGMLELSFEQAEGELFRIFLVHLKSRRTDNKADFESQLRRTREAEACRNRIIERTFDVDDETFLIVGDFNDHPSSSTMRRFYRRGDLQIASLLPATDSRGEVWTYYYKREATYSQIDGIMASSEFLKEIKTGSAQIADLPDALAGSDHRMVYVDILGAAKSSTATKAGN